MVNMGPLESYSVNVPVWLWAAMATAFAVLVFLWDLDATRLREENARLRADLAVTSDRLAPMRPIWASSYGAPPPVGTVESLMLIVEASKPAGVMTETVLEELLQSLRA